MLEDPEVSEVLRGVAPFMQPSPAKNPGGDCFACALTAAVCHFYPEKPLDFDAAWESFKRSSSSGEPVLSNSWGSIWYAAHALRQQGYELEVHLDLVVPQYDVRRFSHAWYHSIPTHDWAPRLEAWLAAGWLALAEMDYDGQGPVRPDGSLNVIDHFVLLDGQRDFWKRSETLPGSAALAHETHVVCSAKGAYWIDTRDLLFKHGVAGLTLIRRDARTYR